VAPEVQSVSPEVHMFSPALAAILVCVVFGIVLFVTGSIDHKMNQTQR
jgi:hypothetical protein